MSHLASYIVPENATQLTLIYATSVIVVVWLLWAPSRRWLVARRIPGPRGYPVVGTALHLQGTGNHTFNVINHWFNEYGSVFKTWSFLNLTVFISDPADVKIILGNKDLVNRSKYFMDAAVYFVGGGLLTARGSKWKTHRKIMNPLFQTQVLDTFVDLFVRRSQQVCEKLEEVADGRTIDFTHYVGCITIDTICRTVIGCQSDTLPGGDEGMMRFFDVVSRCDELVHARVFYPWLMVPWLQSWFALGREAIAARKDLSTFMDGVYSTERGNSSKPSHPKADTSGVVKECKTAVTMLDMMMSTEENRVVLSPKKIRDEILGISLAGFGTTAIGMSALLLLLGIHEDVQDDIVRELDEVFGGDHRPVTAEDLPRFKALERAIKESLRLFPSAALIPREIPQDLTLSSGLVLPAGSNAMIFSYRTHRNEHYFPDPEKFVPDRWLPENRLNSHPFAYIPFGAGTRSCIGHKYAMLQMKAVVGTLLRSYKVSTKLTMEDLDVITVSVTLKLEGKYEMQFTKR